MKLIRIIAILLVGLPVRLQAQEAAVEYKPNIHGVIRTRWEMETERGESRFQVRYARLTVDGQIAPSISYFLQTDLCDQGKMKILDVYGKLRVVKGLYVQGGQFRMPFGVEPHRSPQNYLFANRSFMGKLMCNYRKVGVKAMYTWGSEMPVTIEGGVFDAGTITTQTDWGKSYACSGKATLTAGQFKVSGGALSVLPETTRINMLDGAVSWENAHVTAAAEYMNEHYTDHKHGDSHSYCMYVDYRKRVKTGVFNQWSAQGRFDGQTTQWNGLTDDADNMGAKRITVGTTLTYKKDAVFADVRLNYEKYFYDHGAESPVGFGDKIVAEIVVRF